MTLEKALHDEALLLEGLSTRGRDAPTHRHGQKLEGIARNAGKHAEGKMIVLLLH